PGPQLGESRAIPDWLPQPTGRAHSALSRTYCVVHQGERECSDQEARRSLDSAESADSKSDSDAKIEGTRASAARSSNAPASMPCGTSSGSMALTSSSSTRPTASHEN